MTKKIFKCNFALQKLITVQLLLVPVFAFAVGAPSDSSVPPKNHLVYTPWFTGPLLAPTPINMKPGHPAIEPSLTIFNSYGGYNSHWKIKKQDTTWAINPLIDFQFGLTNDLGIETLVSFISNFKNEKSASPSTF